MDTRNLAEELDLKPLDFADARKVVGNVWEPRWWEAVRTSLTTDPADKMHGDVTDAAEAVRIATQWCGAHFQPGVCEEIAVALTGLRLRMDETLDLERQELTERNEVLEGMVRESLDARTPDRSERIDALEAGMVELSEKIAELTALIGGSASNG